MAKNKWSWLSKIVPTKEELEQWPICWFDDHNNWDWKAWERDWLDSLVSGK